MCWHSFKKLQDIKHASKFVQVGTVRISANLNENVTHFNLTWRGGGIYQTNNFMWSNFA